METTIDIVYEEETAITYWSNIVSYSVLYFVCVGPLLMQTTPQT